ncbi:MAG: hypothetical protein M1829_006413 [Trizodia sp. TS-e1964]|nr:MAG: hypothetical protein M1829_006413 [Trizodia sp. TS-e1964]
MTRGNAPQCKVHFAGKTDDFIVYAESAAAVTQWKSDRSIPLPQVLNGYSVFVTHKHGAQGIMDTASKATLENEFGTSNEDEVVIKILEGGSVQESENGERQGIKNESQGARAGH